MDDDELREWERIAFVSNRGGVLAAQTFAEQGVGQYESAIRDSDSGGNQYGAAYRKGLLVSIRVYREYLETREPGKKPKDAA